MKFKKILFCLALSLLVSACNNDSVESMYSETNEVKLELSMFNWKNNFNEESVETRAGNDDLLYPINIFYVKKGEETIHHLTTVNTGSTYSFSLPDGSFEIYAVCGLSKELIPNKISNNIEIPESSGSIKDFAVGNISLDVTNGKSSKENITIEAKREISWLETKISKVANDVSSINLFIKNLNDKYSFKDRWSLSKENKYTQITLNKTDDPTVYESNIKLPPCADTDNLIIVAEVTTTDNNTQLYSCLVNKELSENVHLSLNISFKDMLKIEDNMSIKEWMEKEEVSVNPNYYPVTILGKSNNEKIYILSHKPLEVTLDEVKEWEDLDNIPFTLEGINVNNWILPTNVSLPNKLLNYIKENGLEKLNANILVSGYDPIDAEATNIISCYYKNTETFNSYDLKNKTANNEIKNTNETFLIYPIGVLTIN